MIADHDVDFDDRRYGKNFVQLLHVRREGSLHHIKEIEVNTALTLNDAREFKYGDNSLIIATDSQKNTVYILAKKNGIRTIEEFAMQLAEHFLTKYTHVTKARVHIEEKSWKRVKQEDKEHVHAFIAAGDATRFCDVEHSKHGHPQVSSGIKGMKIMKTTKSAFTNFVRDEFRSLPDADDRIFCTVVYSKWDYYTLDGLDFDRAWMSVKSSIIDKFAGPPDTGTFSPSVQQTLYQAQKSALSKIPQMSRIEITLPNVHAYEFDLSKYPAFGFTQNKEVFQPTDKPSGNISATLRRRGVKAKL